MRKYDKKLRRDFIKTINDVKKLNHRVEAMRKQFTHRESKLIIFIILT